VSSLERDIKWHRKQIAECRSLMVEVNTDQAYGPCRDYVLKSLRESVLRYEAQLARLEELQLPGR
jgi:hypothetical protein